MNNYYVYVHRKSCDGSVFYIGSGTNNRYRSKQSRNRNWKITAENGYTSQIICNELTKQESREIETLLIEMHGDSIVNIHKQNSSHDLNLHYDFLSELFDIDSSSRTGLVYKIARFKNKGALSKKVGDVAGKVATLPNGKARGFMVKVSFPDGKKRELQVHRVVWLLSNRTICGQSVIDHIDGNPLNNLVSNLREVSYKLNARNKTPKSEGIPGVYIKQNLQWIAEITKDGKRSIKGFSINKYGYETAKQMAIAARMSYLKHLEQIGEPFSERHTLLLLE